MRSKRRLAAIMFSDIVGYTSMLGADENKAIAMVTHHKSVIQKMVPKYEGELIQFYGDGSLSIYPSATFALECALAIQKEFQKKIVVPLRIGIHIGEILIREGNIYGEGVNIASRIESLGQPTTILFSDEVYQKIHNNKNFQTQLLGEFDFKNVERPIKVYALSNEGLRVPKKESISGKLKKISLPKIDSLNVKDRESNMSIAVLSFENYSNQQEQQFFIDGIADEIRSQLLSISNLKVISRSSSMYFKNKPYTLKQIKQELNVKFVLEGRVQIIGDNIKISVDLSNTETNKQIWSLPPISQVLDDIFLLQNKVAKKVVSELKVALTERDKKQLEKISTDNSDAYIYFQRGQELLHRGFGKINKLDEAVDNFKKAIQMDPNFVRAYVGLSDTYLEYIFWGRTAPVKVLEEALNAAMKALELDSTNGECYGALGSINFFKFKKEIAINFLNKAIQLSPNYLGAYEKLAWINIFDGNTKEALRLFSIVHSLDPLSTKYRGDIGHAYYYSHQYEIGIEMMDELLEKYPGDPWLLWMKGYLYSGLGNYEAAINTYLERPTGKKTNWMLAYNYGKIGKTNEATEILNLHLKKRETQHVPGYMIATIYIGLGNRRKALDWLELDYREGGQGLFFWGLKTDPKFDLINNDTRFQKLLNYIT